MKIIIVTGGCGFIGSCLIRKLIAETDFGVINIDKLTYAATEASLWSIDKNPKYSFHAADIRDQSLMHAIITTAKPIAIFHLAAESHVDRSINGPAEFLDTNIMGTYSLVETVRDYLAQTKQENFKFIHVSTDEVYGTLGMDDQKFNESSPYMPNSPYSASKASSDFIVRSWFHTYKFPGIITHCSNNYGPYQFPEKLIPKTIINFLQNKDVPVYGDGLNIRDWIHVEDHCDALMAVLNYGKIGETYDIGSNTEKENIDIVRTIGQLVAEYKNDKNYQPNDLIKFVKDRPGHDLRYAIDSSKIRNRLLWSPSIPFDRGLQKTVTWYLKNQNWWSNLLGGNI